VLSRGQQDADWWQTIGVGGGDSFMEGLGELVLPVEVCEYLESQSFRPVIRYRLVSFAFQVTDRLFSNGTGWLRVPPAHHASATPVLGGKPRSGAAAERDAHDVDQPRSRSSRSLTVDVRETTPF
jgi:hypothetical protein